MRLGYVLIYVPDVAGTVAFYEKAFGLKRRFIDDSGEYGEMETGGTALGFVAERLAEANAIPVQRNRPDQPPAGSEVAFVVEDVAAAYDQAGKAANVAGIVPMGLAWNRAIDTGFADANPYDGIDAGKIDIWSHDRYHASIFGYYLEALLVFGKVTGKDPLSLGRNETVADDMGFSAEQTQKLQQLAHDELAAQK